MFATNESTRAPRSQPTFPGVALSWALLAVAVVVAAPTSGASPGSVLALLGVSAVAAAASVLIPRGVRSARVRAMPLETVEDPDPMAPVGSYRARPPSPRRRVDAAVLRAATAAAAAHGSLEGTVLALAVSFCGLTMRLLEGPPALVILLFVGSWWLMALHAPAEDRGNPAAREGRRYVVLFLAVAVLWCLFVWRACKTESDQADALAARASSTVATIDYRQETFETDYFDQSGYPTTKRYCSVAYHLTAAEVRYTGYTSECSCLAEGPIGAAAPAIYDPADPAKNLLSCERRSLEARVVERVCLLLAGMGVSILILLGARPAKS